MGRKVKIRETYTPDVVVLSRLRDAVKRDENRSSKWRKKVIQLMDELISALATAPSIEDSGK